jgi:hypothetical protein
MKIRKKAVPTTLLFRSQNREREVLRRRPHESSLEISISRFLYTCVEIERSAEAAPQPAPYSISILAKGLLSLAITASGGQVNAEE